MSSKYEEMAEGTEMVREDDMLAYTREVLEQHDNWLTVEYAVNELKVFGAVLAGWAVFAAFVSTVLWLGGVI